MKNYIAISKEVFVPGSGHHERQDELVINAGHLEHLSWIVKHHRRHLWIPAHQLANLHRCLIPKLIQFNMQIFPKISS